MHPLQRLIINRLADLGLTYREAADRSSGLISFGRLNQIANGNLGNLTEKSIRGIALACDVPPAAVRQLAISDADPVQFRLPERAAYLSPRSRKMLMDLTNTLLEAEGLKGKHRPRKDNGDSASATG